MMSDQQKIELANELFELFMAGAPTEAIGERAEELINEVL